jgi:hypothetical protein
MVAVVQPPRSDITVVATFGHVHFENTPIMFEALDAI